MKHNLKDDEEGKEGRSIARARTLATLRDLDSELKGSLLMFLHESELIGYFDEKGNMRGHIISLAKADLTGANLYGADLQVADLSKTKLEGADLSAADLQGANLHAADLRKARLWLTKLTGARLSVADLGGADLGYAELAEANLFGARLNGANLKYTDLSETLLSGVQYDGKTTWPDGFDPSTAGAVLLKTD